MRGGLAGKDRADWLRFLNAREEAAADAEVEARMDALRVRDELGPDWIERLNAEDNSQYLIREEDLAPSSNWAEYGSRDGRSRGDYGDSKKTGSTSGSTSTRKKHGGRKESKESGQYVKIQIKVPVGQKVKAESKGRRTSSSGEKSGSTFGSSGSYSRSRGQDYTGSSMGNSSGGRRGKPHYQDPTNPMMDGRPQYPMDLPPVYEEQEWNPANFVGGHAGHLARQTPRVNFDLPPLSGSNSGNNRHQGPPRPRDDGVVYLGPRDSPWGYPTEEEMARRYPGRAQGQQARGEGGKGGGKIRAEKYTKALGWLAGG